MQFRVPQFLDIEDKVFGPFTFKQFGYLLGAIAFGYIFWKLVPSVIIAFPLILIFSGTFLALAFVKINDRPFEDILEAAYKFIIGEKVLVWHKNETKRNLDLEKLKEVEELKIKNANSIKLKVLDEEKLKDISKKLDILKENTFKVNEVVKENKSASLRDHLLRQK